MTKPNTTNELDISKYQLLLVSVQYYCHIADKTKKNGRTQFVKLQIREKQSKAQV